MILKSEKDQEKNLKKKEKASPIVMTEIVIMTMIGIGIVKTDEKIKIVIVKKIDQETNTEIKREIVIERREDIDCRKLYDKSSTKFQCTMIMLT